MRPPSTRLVGAYLAAGATSLTALSVMVVGTAPHPALLLALIGVALPAMMLLAIGNRVPATAFTPQRS